MTTLHNVQLISLDIDAAGFAAMRVRDLETGHVLIIACGYVQKIEKNEVGQVVIRTSTEDIAVGIEKGSN